MMFIAIVPALFSLYCFPFGCCSCLPFLPLLVAQLQHHCAYHFLAFPWRCLISRLFYICHQCTWHLHHHVIYCVLVIFFPLSLFLCVHFIITCQFLFRSLTILLVHFQYFQWAQMSVHIWTLCVTLDVVFLLPTILQNTFLLLPFTQPGTGLVKKAF